MKLTHMVSAVMAVSMVANVAAEPTLTLRYIKNNFEFCAEEYSTYSSEDRALIANEAINKNKYVDNFKSKEEQIQPASRNRYFTYTGLGIATTGAIAAGVYYYMNPETAQAHYDVVNNSRVADYTRKGCDWVANTQAAQTVGEWTRNTCNSASEKLASLWTHAFGENAQASGENAGENASTTQGSGASTTQGSGASTAQGSGASTTQGSGASMAQASGENAGENVSTTQASGANAGENVSTTQECGENVGENVSTTPAYNETGNSVDSAYSGNGANNVETENVDTAETPSVSEVNQAGNTLRSLFETVATIFQS